MVAPADVGLGVGAVFGASASQRGNGYADVGGGLPPPPDYSPEHKPPPRRRTAGSVSQVDSESWSEAEFRPIEPAVVTPRRASHFGAPRHATGPSIGADGMVSMPGSAFKQMAEEDRAESPTGGALLLRPLPVVTARPIARRPSPRDAPPVQVFID